MEGSWADPSAKSDCCPTSQEVTVTREDKYTKLSHTVSTEDTTIPLCVKNEIKGEITQATAPYRVETITEEMTDTLAHEVLFEAKPTEVAFSLSLRTWYESASEKTNQTCTLQHA